MTAYSEIDAFEPVTSEVVNDKGPFEVAETYWGYIVRSSERASVGMMFMQVVSWALGISFCLAALGLWLAPSSVFNGSVFGMKAGASVFMAAMAAFCLWFASRGTDSEIQIDTKLGEIREVVRNRAGRPTLIGRYGFDSIGSVSIEVGMERNDLRQTEGELVLQYRNTSEKLYVARGAAVRLSALRDRIGRDMMISGARQTPSGKLIAA